MSRRVVYAFGALAVLAGVTAVNEGIGPKITIAMAPLEKGDYRHEDKLMERKKLEEMTRWVECANLFGRAD